MFELQLAVNELQQLTSFAEGVFAGLEQGVKDCEKRVEKAAGRMDSARAAVQQQRGNGITTNADLVARMKVGGEKKFTPKARTPVDKFFSVNTRPKGLRDSYQRCRELPDFSHVDKFSDTPCREKFSDPGFFLREWYNNEIAKQNDMQEKKNKKKKDRIAAPSPPSKPTEIAVGNADPAVVQDQAPPKRQARPASVRLPPGSTFLPVTSAVTAETTVPQPQPPPPQPVRSSVSLPPPTVPLRGMATATKPPPPATTAPPPPIPPRELTSANQGTSDIRRSRRERTDGQVLTSNAPPIRPPRSNLPIVAITESQQTSQPSPSPQSLYQPVIPARPPVVVEAPPAPITRITQPPPPTTLPSSTVPPQPNPTTGRRIRPPPPPAPTSAAVATSSSPTRAPPQPLPHPSPPPISLVVTSPSSPSSSHGGSPFQPQIAAVTSPVIPRERRDVPTPPAPPPSLPAVPPVYLREPAPTIAVAAAAAPTTPEGQAISSPRRVPLPDVESTPSAPIDENDPLRKYKMMQKMNMPRGAIEQAMIRGDVNPALLFPDYVPPVANVMKVTAVAAAPKATQPNNDSSDLLAQLRDGPSRLKTRPQEEENETHTASPQSDLIAAIAGGAGRLRKLDDSLRPENKAPPPPTLDGGGVAAILARRIAIIGEQGSVSGDSDGGGSEWGSDND